MPISGTVTKAHIIDAVAERNGFTMLPELIKQSLESGDDVLISGFRGFCVKKKRRGRNPADAKSMMTEPVRLSHFNAQGR